MRKLFKLILLSCAILLLAACSTNKDEAATIEDVKLDKAEQGVISSLADQYFYYEIKIKDRDIRNVYWGIDVYRKGKRVSQHPFSGGILSEEDLEKPVKLFLARQAEDRPAATWISQLYTESGLSGTTSTDESADYLKNKGFGVRTIPSDTVLKKGERKVIGRITSTDQDPYPDIPAVTDKEIQALTKRYDTAYFLWIKLK